MDSKIAQVKKFFDEPDAWPKNNYQTKVRSLLVKDLLGDITCRTILDLGCGDGSISLQFVPRANHVTMVDLSSSMLARAKENTPLEYRARVSYINANVQDLEAEEPYDVVLCIGVLAHVDCVEKTIARVSSLVKLGGRCIFQITDGEQILGRILSSYESARRRISGKAGYLLSKTTLSQVIALASGNKLKLVAVRRHALLLPGMGRLPKKWLLNYDLFVANCAVLSHYGTGALLLFEKEARAI